MKPVYCLAFGDYVIVASVCCATLVLVAIWLWRSAAEFFLADAIEWVGESGETEGQSKADRVKAVKLYHPFYWVLSRNVKRGMVSHHTIELGKGDFHFVKRVKVRLTSELREEFWHGYGGALRSLLDFVASSMNEHLNGKENAQGEIALQAAADGAPEVCIIMERVADLETLLADVAKAQELLEALEGHQYPSAKECSKLVDKLIEKHLGWVDSE